MLAVGGYGRRELFPYSDIDIMILLENESLTATIKESLSEFMRLLWDAGLRLSHSVRTVNDCAEVHDQQSGAEHQPARPALTGAATRRCMRSWKPACRCFLPSRATA